MRNTHIIVIIALLVVAYILFTNIPVFKTDGLVTSPAETGLSLPTPSFPNLQFPQLGDNMLANEAWLVFENYLEYAKIHNIAGVKSLSYQLSETCSNPETESDCFALMDNLYEIASPLKKSDFTHIQFDSRQIIMSTDGDAILILYFVRNENGDPKILGLSYCIEDPNAGEQCVETDTALRDKDNNGWWDNVEALFYK